MMFATLEKRRRVLNIYNITLRDEDCIEVDPP